MAKIKPTPSDYPKVSHAYGKLPTVVHRDYGQEVQTWGKFASVSAAINHLVYKASKAASEPAEEVDQC
tara:strand:- start:70 stop:273 length:204 start_codon:yes stop_codon:yes gene_type:complete